MLENGTVHATADYLKAHPYEIPGILQRHADAGVTIRLALKAIPLDGVTTEILGPTTDETAAKIDVMATFIGDASNTLPFQEILLRIIPNALGEWFNRPLVEKFKKLQRGLRRRNPKDFSAEEAAFYELYSLNGRDWEDDLRASTIFPMFFSQIVQHILDRMNPQTDEDLLSALKASKSSITKPASLVSDDFSTLVREDGLLGNPVDMQRFGSHLIADPHRQNALTFDTTGAQHNLRGRGCSMNAYGDLGKLYDFYIAVAEAILRKRNSSSQ